MSSSNPSADDHHMRDPDKAVIIFSDGRAPLTRRDLIRDNPETLRREWLGMDGDVTRWVTAEAIEQARVHWSWIEPWGTYERGPANGMTCSQKKLCDCVLSNDPGPSPVCDEFDRDEEGLCFTCGHEEKCHVE